MSAQFRAIVSLSFVFACAAFAESPGGAGVSPVLVYLETGSNADSASLPFMRRETETLLRTAGYHVEWRDAGGTREPDTRADLVVVRLAGSCTAPVGQNAAAASPDGLQRLATTPVVDGRILPFSQVDCAALTRVLAASLTDEAPARRTYLYGRAMGRLVAHELYHILGQTTEHSRSGVGKSCFSLGDLTAEVFEFEPGALARLRRLADPANAAAHGMDDGTPAAAILNGR
jgi:hypothetical protein